MFNKYADPAQEVQSAEVPALHVLHDELQTLQVLSLIFGQVPSGQLVKHWLFVRKFGELQLRQLLAESLHVLQIEQVKHFPEDK